MLLGRNIFIPYNDIQNEKLSVQSDILVKNHDIASQYGAKLLNSQNKCFTENEGFHLETYDKLYD